MFELLAWRVVAWQLSVDVLPCTSCQSEDRRVKPALKDIADHYGIFWTHVLQQLSYPPCAIFDDLAECGVWLLRRQNLLVLAALELRRQMRFSGRYVTERPPKKVRRTSFWKCFDVSRQGMTQQNLILVSGSCCFKWGRRPHPQTTCLWRRGGSASHCHCRAGSFRNDKFV